MSQFRLQRAAECIARGGVIAYPTEAVWGLGCDPFNADAVARLLRLKNRSPAKGLILVAGDIAQFQPWLMQLSSHDYRLLADSWPGPVTWLVPVNEFTPAWISGNFDTVALRVSAHPLIRQLTQRLAMPVVSTSANPQGYLPARSSLTVRRYFPTGLDAILPGVTLGAAKPSEIRSLLTGEVVRTS